jgi:hypothetical protein
MNPMLSTKVLNLYAVIEAILIPMLPLVDLHSLLLTKSFKRMSKKDLLMKELVKRVQTQQCHPDRHRPETFGHFCFCSLLIRLFSRHSLGKATGVSFNEPNRLSYLVRAKLCHGFEHVMFAKTDFTDEKARIRMTVNTHGYQRRNHKYQSRIGVNVWVTKIATAICSVNHWQSQIDRFGRLRGYLRKNIVNWNSGIVQNYDFSVNDMFLSKAQKQHFEQDTRPYSPIESGSDVSEDDNSDLEYHQEWCTQKKRVMCTQKKRFICRNQQCKNYYKRSSKNNTEIKNDTEIKSDPQMGNPMRRLLNAWPKGGQMEAFQNRAKFNPKYIVPSYDTYRSMADRQFSSKGIKKFMDWKTKRDQNLGSSTPILIDHTTPVVHWEFTDEEKQKGMMLETNDPKKVYQLTKEGKDFYEYRRRKDFHEYHRRRGTYKIEMQEFLKTVRANFAMQQFPITPFSVRGVTVKELVEKEHENYEFSFSQLGREYDSEDDQNQHDDYGMPSYDLLAAEAREYIKKYLFRFIAAALRRGLIQDVTVVGSNCLSHPSSDSDTNNDSS